MPPVRKVLVAAAALAGIVISAYPSSAQPLAPSSADSSTVTARPAAVGSFEAFSDTYFSGPSTVFSGVTGVCYFVGDGWNDSIRSARTNSAFNVELWDNAGCTGGAIVVDATGYSRIGAWVSAYRIT